METIEPARNGHQARSLEPAAGMEPDSALFSAALEERGELVLPLKGASMGKKWEGADAVVVRALHTARPRMGDVAVFARNGRWYAHRWIGSWRKQWITKGDGRWAWDRPLLRPDEALGVVTALVEKGERRPLPRGPAWSAFRQLFPALLALPFLGLMRRIKTRNSSPPEDPRPGGGPG